MDFAYIGCRTTKERNARGEGISVYKITDNKNWQLLEIVKTLENPSYLAFDKNKKFLFATHGDLEKISSFRLNKQGIPEFINTVNAGGKNPVYLTVNKSNKFLFVATLQGGAISTLKINLDGSLSEPIYIEKLEPKNGISHAHQCLLDNEEEFLIVPTQARNLGYERLWIFRVNNETGKLSQVSSQAARLYSEPRHTAISSDNRRIYLINERGNTISYYGFNPQNGEIEGRQIIPTLPETYLGDGQASGILIHPNNKFLYGSNRIHESIAIFRINENTGFLTLHGFSPVLGKTPRFICFNEDSSELIVANEDSDTLRFFEINQENGFLTYKDKFIETPSPTCLIFK